MISIAFSTLLIISRKRIFKDGKSIMNCQGEIDLHTLNNHAQYFSLALFYIFVEYQNVTKQCIVK